LYWLLEAGVHPSQRIASRLLLSFSTTKKLPLERAANGKTVARRGKNSWSNEMKRLFALTAFAALAACSLHAQAVSTTVCDVIKNPASFDGKTVTIKGTVVAGFDQFVLKDGDCNKEVSAIWLNYPAGSKAKAGPQVTVEMQPAKNFAGKAAPANRAAVTLTKDKEFKTFDSALSALHNTNNFMCLGCAKNEVQATITGRLDGVQRAYVKREGGKITSLGGFGNMNAYPARLVIASVAEVTPKEVDYTKADEAAKAAQKAMEKMGGPPVMMLAPSNVPFPDVRASAEKFVNAMAAGPLATAMQKDLSMIPKQKEQNGVILLSGTANEVRANEGAAGTDDSPDGVIYYCTFNRDKLPNLAITATMMHVGQHISDMRAPIEGNEEAPMAVMENNAWAVTSTLGIFGGEKLITAQGGYVMWNSTWPQSDQVANMQSALGEYLSKEALLNR
jgi:hypothetical protein